MKTLFLFIATLALVGAGCASNVQTQTDNSPEGASLKVPGEEQINPDKNTDELGSATDVEAQAETQVEVETQAVGLDDQEPPQEETQSEPESVLVTIVAKTWQFEPSTIRVKEGQRVDLQIVSVDVAHGFNLSAFGIDERLEPGKTVRASFVADKKGTFSFFCDVFCGDGHGGMRGTLIVE